jgi:hypothetical protein
MPGLANSRWAPQYNRASLYSRSTKSYGSGTTTETTITKSTTTTSTQSLPRIEPTTAIQSIRPPRLPDSYNELTRYTKIVRRLKWKLPFLAAGYRQAIDRVGPHVDRERAAEAELMFKIDFYEYYMLIERALVHLLSVFGIAVPASFYSQHHRDGSGRSTPSNGRYAHRYHANVLEALEQADNPLHAALGTGEVRRQLRRAKDLRNRWKNVDDPTAGERSSNYKGAATAAAPLESYDLEGILTVIFDGFDQAFIVAEGFVMGELRAARDGAGLNEGPAGASGDVMDGFEAPASEEEQWEFMVEAMDWEAV